MKAIGSLTPDAIVRRSAFWIACFASVALLLGHLYNVAHFHKLGLSIGIAAMLVMAVTWRWAVKVKDESFLLCLKVGLIGGLWGTIGYDVVRIPLHLAGLNPFPPIRIYGMWLAGAEHSTPWTDLLGFAYHFTNGITFAWIYSLLMLRRHWLWAVLWGMILEVFAIVTVFGDVFNIRYAPTAMILAFAAHLFYGYPLGKACHCPEKTVSETVPLLKKGRGLLTCGVLAFCFIWFFLAWQPIGKQGDIAQGEMRIGPDSLYPGCSDVSVGDQLTIRNTLDENVSVLFRRPQALNERGESFEIPPGGEISIAVDGPGVHQLLVPELGWRSIVALAQREGDYQPERGKD